MLRHTIFVCKNIGYLKSLQNYKILWLILFNCIKKWGFIKKMAVEIVKKYFSIKEVSERFSVSESTLRAWEREFSNLKPKRSGANDRKYTIKDIEQIEIIISARKDKKLTVGGAKAYIKNKEYKKTENQEVVEKLTSLRNFLEQLKNDFL